MLRRGHGRGDSMDICKGQLHLKVLVKVLHKQG